MIRVLRPTLEAMALTDLTPTRPVAAGRRAYYTPVPDLEAATAEFAALGVLGWLAHTAADTPVRLAPTPKDMITVTWDQCGAGVTVLLKLDFPHGAPEVVTALSLWAAFEASQSGVLGPLGVLPIGVFIAAAGTPPAAPELAGCDTEGRLHGQGLAAFAGMCEAHFDARCSVPFDITDAIADIDQDPPTHPFDGHSQVVVPRTAVEAIGATRCFVAVDPDEEVWVGRLDDQRLFLAGSKAVVFELAA